MIMDIIRKILKWLISHDKQWTDYVLSLTLPFIQGTYITYIILNTQNNIIIIQSTIPFYIKRNVFQIEKDK